MLRLFLLFQADMLQTQAIDRLAKATTNLYLLMCTSPSPDLLILPPSVYPPVYGQADWWPINPRLAGF